MIAIVNPNSTETMTAHMLATAKAAHPGAEITGWTSYDGPVAIQGPEDGEACLPPLLKLVETVCNKKPRALIIGCADDTGLEAIRDIASCPVLGIGQAAYHLAAMAGARFSVVTTLPASVAILEDNVRRYGLGGQLGAVHASGVAVLDLERDRSAATAQVLETIVHAHDIDGVQSVVLGCAGMSHIPAAAPDVGVRMIDGVVAATGIALALA
ncbi:MAG: aspartate/glutamate racemase family protein [Pseudomonadota bacterium]